MRHWYTGCDTAVKRIRHTERNHGSVILWQIAGMTNDAKPPHYIKHWRKVRGLSLHGLANRMEVEPGGDLLISHASLQRIEDGKQPFSEPILNALSVALDVPRAWLLDRNPEADGEVIDLVKRLGEADRKRVIEMIQLMLATA